MVVVLESKGTAFAGLILHRHPVFSVCCVEVTHNQHWWDWDDILPLCEGLSQYLSLRYKLGRRGRRN